MGQYFFKALRRGCASLLVGASLMGLIGLSNVKADDEINYNFLSGYGDYKLLMEHNDIYIEKIDGSEKRQITHTPNIKEHNAVFSKDGNYIIVVEKSGKNDPARFFVIKRESDDSIKREVSISEAFWLTSGIQ